MAETLWIPCRSTSSINLPEQILEHTGIASCGTPELDEAVRSRLLIEADVKTLAELRTQFLASASEPVSSQLESAVLYLSGILSLARCEKLDEVSFPWINSLSCSRAVTQQNGLVYEIANVSFNVAALYSQMAAQSSAHQAPLYLQMSAGTWDYLKSIVLPHFVYAPPPELSREAAEFFRRLCLVEASGLHARTTSMAWALIKEYESLLIDLAKLPFQSSELHSRLLDRKLHLQCATYLNLARSLHRSRKREDQLLEKSILMECQKLTSDEMTLSEIARLLHEPKNRRTHVTLAEIGETESFNAEKYFGETNSECMLASVPFVPPSSRLFDNVLPAHFVLAPSILKLRYLHYVQTAICARLEQMNHKTRECLTLNNIPVGVEVTLRPGSLPASLIPALTALGVDSRVDKTNLENTHKTILPRFKEAENMLHRCEALLKQPEATRLHRVLGESLNSTQKRWNEIRDFLEINKELFSLLNRCRHSCADEGSLHTALADVLRLPSTRNSAHKVRSTPTYMDQAQKLSESLQKRMDERDAHWKAVLVEAQSKTFSAEVKNLARSGELLPPAVDNEALDSILESAVNNLTPELDYVARESAATEQQLSEIRRFTANFRQYTRKLLAGERSSEPTIALMFAIAKWQDLDFDISCLIAKLKVLMNIASLETSIYKRATDFEGPQQGCQLLQQDLTTKGHCGLNTESESDDITHQFDWKLGNSINICIK